MKIFYKLSVVILFSLFLVSCSNKASMVYQALSPSVVQVVVRPKSASGSEYALAGTGWATDWNGKSIYITAGHVVESPVDKDGVLIYEFAIRYKGQIYPINYKISDTYDIAIMIPLKKLPNIPLLKLSKKNPNIGDDVYVIGNPVPAGEEFINVIEPGIVNQYVSIESTKVDGAVSGAIMGINSRVAPGNSGGPIINSEFEIVGLVSNGYRSYSQFQFGIPIEFILKELKILAK